MRSVGRCVCEMNVCVLIVSRQITEVLVFSTMTSKNGVRDILDRDWLSIR